MAFRCTPICLYLCGAPAIGKSHLSLPIADYINSKLFNVKNHVFPITVVTDHWDGYFQQPIVILDDHYKKQDDKNEVDAGVVMSIVSCTSFLPNFDNLAFKTLQFVSPFVIINSNFGFPNTIYLPAALHRRHRHHVIVIKINEKYASNFDHLLFKYARSIIDPFHGMYPYPFSKLHDVPYNMSEWNIFPYKNLYRTVSLKQLCDILIDDYNNEMSIFNNVQKFSIV